MSVSAFAMIRKFAKTPVAAVFTGVLDSSGNVTGLGSNAIATLGTFSDGRRIKGPATVSMVLSSASFNFTLYLTGNRAQDFFTSVVVENGAGTPTTLLRSDASFVGYLVGVDLTAWSWGNGSARIWETSDNGETKKVIVL